MTEMLRSERRKNKRERGREFIGIGKTGSEEIQTRTSR